MDWNPQTLQFLSQSFLDTVSPQLELRHRAEENLSNAAYTPNYGLAVLRLVAEPSVDEQTRQCAAINFKNHLKIRWVPSSATPIPDFEKQQIKTLIVPLILFATPQIQAELIEALAVIGNHDVPEFWPDLKSSLETAMIANDFASVNGILATLNSLFTSVHHDLFASDEILQQIIIPNLMLRNEDEELFEKNYLEFIRRDMEAGNTRRRIACELLNRKNKDKMRAQIHHCLTLFDENPSANWKYKECAIYLVVSLATGNGASISTNDLIDVESFFKSVIVPELQSGEEDVNAFPMLKAAALKFFTVFRFLIPKHVAMPLLRALVRYVDSDWSAVHSYAAICIEKLLLMKDNNNGVKSQPRYTSTDIHTIYEDLIIKLLNALRMAEENHYIMRCFMRVAQIAAIDSWMPGSWIDGLNRPLCWVLFHCPKKPLVYSHLLFETIAILVRRGFELEPGCVSGLRICIRGITKMILHGDVPEFFPYAFQLLAQLVDLHKPPVPFPRVYMGIFDDIFSEYYLKLWETTADVPALALLLESFLQQVPDEVNKEGRLRHVVVGIIDKLVSSPTTEEEGFRLLNIVIEKYEYGVIAEYMNQIWVSLFTRLQNSKTLILVRCVIVFMSLFSVKHGVQTLVDLINSVEVNLFHVILREIWIPNLTAITGYTEVKLCAIASTKLLYESALLLDPAAEELWGKLLDAIVTLLSLPEEESEKERVEDDDDDDEEPDLIGFLLRNVVGKKEEEWDPLKEMEIKDPKQFLVGFPANVSSVFRGKFPLAIMRHLSPPNQAALVKLCNSYNIAVV